MKVWETSGSMGEKRKSRGDSEATAGYLLNETGFRSREFVSIKNNSGR